MTGFSQGMGDVRARARQGQIGDVARVSHLTAFMSGINKAPQGKQVSTLAVTDPGDNTDISVTINGVVVTVNTGTGLNQDQVGTLIRDGINAEPLVRAAVLATYDATANDLILTAKIPGLAFTVTDNTTGLGAPSTVAAVTAESIPFGRVLLGQGPANAGEPEEAVALAKVSYLVAQVITATVVNGVATARNIRAYEIRGEERILLVNTVYTGNATEATEAAAIVAAFNTAAPANTVLAANPSGADVTFTAEKVGMEIDVEIEQVTAGDITFANTTGPDETTSLHRAFVGVSMFSAADERASGDEEGSYEANRGVKFLARGEVWVAQSQAPSPSDLVYVETAAGVDSGKVFNTTSATRLALARRYARWVRNATPATDAMSVLHVDSGRVP